VRENPKKEAARLSAGRTGAKRSRSRFAESQGNRLGLAAFRAKVLREREIDTVGEAFMLRGKPPEESIEIMFDMVEFLEDLAKAVENS
jgi:hypothetical protein